MSHKQEFELSINIQHVSTSTDKAISSPIVDRLLEVSDSTFRNEYVDYYALSDHICFAHFLLYFVVRIRRNVGIIICDLVIFM